MQVTRDRVRLSGGRGPSQPFPLRHSTRFLARVQRRLSLHTPSFAHCASDSATTVPTLPSTSVCNPLAPSLSAARNQTRPPPPCTRRARRLPNLICPALPSRQRLAHWALPYVHVCGSFAPGVRGVGGAARGFHFALGRPQRTRIPSLPGSVFTSARSVHRTALHCTPLHTHLYPSGGTGKPGPHT